MGPAFLAIPACYEIPPQVPEDYVGSKPPPGWPPPAAYSPDPLAPVNRWFHRAFAVREPGGRLGPAWATDPAPPDSFGRVDLAELAALLKESGRPEALAPLTVGGPAASVAPVLASDILQVALAVARNQDGDALSRELLGELLSVARRVGVRGRVCEDAMAPLGEAPPLRAGTWMDAPPPDSPELMPSAEDIRWTRLLYRDAGGGPPAGWALLRLRVALGGAGDPLLLPFASECLEIRTGGESPDGSRARLWLFHRARWAAGLDPWILAFEDDGGGERGLARSAAPEEGAPAHALFRMERPEAPGIAYHQVLEKSWRDRQRVRIQRVLREALGDRVAPAP